MNSAYLARTTMCALILLSVCSCAVASSPGGTPPDQAVAQGSGFAVFCGEDFAVADRPISGSQNGIYGIDLKTGRVAWNALSDKITDVGPVAAGDAVAVITDHFSTVYAFSKTSGKLLWQKQLNGKSSALVSDGRHFYVNDLDEQGDFLIDVLDSHTGKTLWTIGDAVSDLSEIHGHFFYSAGGVVDLASRKLVHRWPEGPAVYALAVWDGAVVLGDVLGDITVYNASFKMINRIHAGDTTVGAVAANEDGILVSLKGKDSNHRGTIEFLTWDGKHKWSMLGFPLGVGIFTIAGGNVLMIEPVTSDTEWHFKPGEKWQFDSRSLATGKVNWKTSPGDYWSPPAVCGDTAFVLDGDRIAGFKVSDGTSYKGGDNRTH